ncbi:glycosyltransferase family 2 protein [Dictyobacter halimunensis]|uniref:glycosyltransferase family 2 protein n=1 Tax=Dictyobacter halimunensis TaxID=3026934 RepID=UPI0030C6C7DB
MSSMPQGQSVQVGVVPDQHVAPGAVSERKLSYSLSVVLPAYNEEAVIEQTVTMVASALRTWTDDFEIIVVDDGSRDHTRDIIERLIGDEPRIRLMHHSQNRGYGAALVTGFHTASKELVFFMDSDGQFDINDLERFFPLIEHCDAVLGYRAPRHDPWIRKLNAWGWKQLVHLVLGIKVRDLDCAFKLYRAEFFQTLNLETRGAMINAEILYKFVRAGHIYTEVGVRHLPRQKGKATGAHPRVILKAMRELISYSRKWKLAERARQRL